MILPSCEPSKSDVRKIITGSEDVLLDAAKRTLKRCDGEIMVITSTVFSCDRIGVLDEL